jgi:sporulation protein YlmC with PRC-barrel domain
MQHAKQYLLMTTAAALCVAPMLAFGQANTGGSSRQTITTQTSPDQGALSGAPSARDAAPTATVTSPGGANSRDGTPGNPPSTATQRAADSVTGNRTDPDGTGNNPPGTAAGRAIDRATSSATGATTGSMAVDSSRLQGGRRASEVIGANVYNENDETIGEVDDIIIPQGGTQPVAILSVGGFLGIGARLVAIPYEQLQHAADRDRWMLRGATKDSLREMPEYRHQGDRRG